MTNVKSNFSSIYEDEECNLCEENQLQNDCHLLECPAIIEKCNELACDNETEYQDLFDNIQSQMRAVKIFLAIFKTKQLIEEEENN